MDLYFYLFFNLKNSASVVLNLKLGIRDIQDFQDLIGNLSLSHKFKFFR